MTDYLAELNKEIAEINMLAFDQGVELAFDRIITLCEISGGRLTTKQLREFKKYLDDQIVKQNERKRNDQSNLGEETPRVGGESEPTNDAPIQFGYGIPDAEGVHAVATITSDHSAREEAQASEGQGSEAVPQAESS